MRRAGLRPIMVVAAILVGSVFRAEAQEPAPPPRPLDTSAPAAAPAASLPAADASTNTLPAAVLDPWQMGASYEDSNGRLLAGDPFLEPPNFPGTGLIATVGVNIFSPHYKNQLAGNVTIPGVGATTVRLATAPLPWVALPTIQLGWRFGEGLGAFVATYRYILDDGLGIIPNFDAAGAASLKSRLNMNIVDMDYTTRENFLGPMWDVQWRVGARIATQYFDSKAEGAILAKTVSSSEYAAGPHAGIELYRWLVGSGQGLALYGMSDTAFLFGRVRQNMGETISQNGVPVTGGAVTQESSNNFPGVGSPGLGSSQWLPVFRVQAGLNWVPNWASGNLRFSGGYAFEGWWWLARLPGPVNGASTSTLTTNGIFLRGEWKY